MIEIFIAFVVGILVVAIVAFVFGAKLKVFVILLINVTIGAIALTVLSVFGIWQFELNSISALFVGLMGVFGILPIALILIFL
ncbi:MAG: hypothetical protein FWD86_03090 [Firmicutes bacterium]|nr:hypothetical protein [Bacillota bacterium]